jgi:hypothetical protein
MDRPVIVAGSTGALVAVVVGVGALVVLHLLPTGLSPVRNAVSQYGITAYRLGYRVQTLAYAVAGAAVAVALSATSHPATSVVALCAVFAAARAALSWFPMDTPGATPTVTGRRHGLLAILAFCAITAAAVRLGRQGSGSVLSGAATAASAVVGALMIASLLGMVVSRRTTPPGRYFGAVERAFYVLVTVWLVVVPIVLLVRD